MRVFAPKYYEKFKCIAEKCSHSCCVGWEIDVDPDTKARHASSSHSLSRELMESLAQCEGIDYIELSNDGRCPFLDCSGLCRIISEMGEDHTSRICREHPRFYHRIADRVECGIGAVCEEAARIILDSDDYDSFTECEREEHIPPSAGCADIISHRENIYRIVKSAHSFSDAVVQICEIYSIARDELFSDDISEILFEMELLDESHREMLTTLSDECSQWADKYIRRFFSYLIYRHLGASESTDMIASRVAFAILLTFIYINALHGDENVLQAVECARIISEEIEYSEDNTAALAFQLYTTI